MEDDLYVIIIYPLIIIFKTPQLPQLNLSLHPRFAQLHPTSPHHVICGRVQSLLPEEGQICHPQHTQTQYVSFTFSNISFPTCSCSVEVVIF